MDEIHIMCDMYMDEAGIPMLITMSQRINNGDQGSKYGSQSIHIQMVIHDGGLNGRLNTNVDMKK